MAVSRRSGYHAPLSEPRRVPTPPSNSHHQRPGPRRWVSQVQQLSRAQGHLPVTGCTGTGREEAANAITVHEKNDRIEVLFGNPKNFVQLGTVDGVKVTAGEAVDDKVIVQAYGGSVKVTLNGLSFVQFVQNILTHFGRRARPRRAQLPGDEDAQKGNDGSDGVS